MQKTTSLIYSGLLLGLMISKAPAQDIVNLTGKITDQTGKPLAGVTVALKNLKKTTTSGADGTYQLSGTTNIASGISSKASSIRFNNRILEFTVRDETVPARIQIFNMVGKPIASLVNGELARGNYRINPFSVDLNSQVAFLSIKLGPETAILKMFGSGDQSLPAAILNFSESDKTSALLKTAALKKTPALSKTAALTTDTLVVNKIGWSSDDKTIESFTGVNDFMLVQPEVFWGVPASYPVAKNVMTYVFLNRTNGKFTDDKIFWSFGNQTHTIAEQSTIDMPANSSGRVNFHLETANGKYWDFMEHTISPTNWYGNTTRVDGYGIPIAIRLICGDGTDELLGEKYETFYKGREAFLKTYRDAMPAAFKPTIDNGAPYRIIAPGKGDGGFGPGQAFANYFDAYLKEVGVTTATTNQAFACEGNPFGQNAQLAGAVNRHVAHLPKSEWTKAENFYKQAPANYYAKFFHDVSFQHKAYGFAYDDAEGYAAYTACAKPKTLIIAIGY